MTTFFARLRAEVIATVHAEDLAHMEFAARPDVVSKLMLLRESAMQIQATERGLDLMGKPLRMVESVAPDRVAIMVAGRICGACLVEEKADAS